METAQEGKTTAFTFVARKPAAMIFVCDDNREISRALLLLRAGDKLYYRELQDAPQIRFEIEQLQKVFRTPPFPAAGRINKNGAAWLSFYF